MPALRREPAFPPPPSFLTIATGALLAAMLLATGCSKPVESAVCPAPSASYDEALFNGLFRSPGLAAAGQEPAKIDWFALRAPETRFTTEDSVEFVVFSLLSRQPTGFCVRDAATNAVVVERLEMLRGQENRVPLGTFGPGKYLLQVTDSGHLVIRMPFTVHASSGKP